MKSLKRSTFVGLALIAAIGGLGKAYGDAAFTINGAVPNVSFVELAWVAENFGLMAGKTVPVAPADIFYRAVAAINVYSNHAAGFDIRVAGADAAGNLAGVTTPANKVPYEIGLATTQANAEAGTAATINGVASVFVDPVSAGADFVTSGALTVPYDTAATPLFVSVKLDQSDTKDLLADSYADDITITITEN